MGSFVCPVRPEPAFHGAEHACHLGGRGRCGAGCEHSLKAAVLMLGFGSVRADKRDHSTSVVSTLPSPAIRQQWRP
jgi:hypothetical protein